MKSGLTIPELRQAVDDVRNNSRDFIVDTRKLQMIFRENETQFWMEEVGGPYRISPYTHEQIGTYTGIPKQYYERMAQQQPDLLARNVNTWFLQKKEPRMLRTFGGKARAFLSDRYRPLDNFDLLAIILPVIEANGCIVESCNLTEKKLYLKAVSPKVVGEIRVGDVVQAGLVVSNSEIGCGSLSVQPLVLRLACLNGAIMTDFGKRRRHVGRRWSDDNDETFEIMSDETRKADDIAFWLKVRDVVKATVDETKFALILNKWKEATEKKINDPIKTVELAQKEFTWSEEERNEILKQLIEEKDFTAYGLTNTVTWVSQHVADYDRATELEADGGAIITANWNVLNPN